MLQQVEDAYVDRLITPLSRIAHLVWANFPRSYIDVNRAITDIDPAMVSAPIVARPTLYSDAGMGLFHRDVRPGRALYDRQLTLEEVSHRIATCYRPYYAAISSAIALAGYSALYLNVHSMPSVNAPVDARGRPYDMLIGTGDGATADHDVLQWLASIAVQHGLSVGMNIRYKGGQLIRQFGKPRAGVQALQLEFNRQLYMNERMREFSPRGAGRISDLLATIALAWQGQIHTALAAE